MATSLLDHITITVRNVEASLAFYRKVLGPLGITDTFVWTNENAPPGHPCLHGLGHDRRFSVWLKPGVVNGPAHVGFAARNESEVQASYNAAILAGGTPDMKYGGAPGARPWYFPGYYAANVLDLDGNELEFTFKGYKEPASGTD